MSDLISFNLNLNTSTLFVDSFSVNIMNEFWGIVICTVGLLITFIYKKELDSYLRLIFRDIRILFICNIFSMLSDMVGSILNGKVFPGARLIALIANTDLYLSNDLMLFFFSIFVLHCLRRNLRKDKYTWLVWAILIFNVGILFMSHYNGCVFFLDAENYYHRGPLFTLNHCTAIFLIIADLILVIRYPHKKNRYLRIMIYLSSILPVLALVAGILIEGVIFLYMVTSILLLIFVLGLCQHNAWQMMAQEKEMMKQSMNAMVSQLQPHFLYNSISSIMGIEGNPPQTREALADFSKYLRGNLDVLKAQKPILFEKELEHVRAYLDLEKIRFGDKLEIIYNIEERDFLIPALTVQMMAENAVRHGLIKKEGKGTVTISSQASMDGLEEIAIVTVEDNGIGFDPEQTTDDERSHVGLVNTRERLKLMVDGSMKIESQPGIGTKITIMVPR